MADPYTRKEDGEDAGTGLVERIELELQRFEYSREVEEFELVNFLKGNNKISEYYSSDFAAHIILAELNLFTQKVYNETVEYPGDWWQAVRARFFPKWYLRRYPVKNATHTFNVQAFYPKMNLMPDHPVHFIQKLDSFPMARYRQD